MNLTVEKGKTLLIEGPASVHVLSGKVDVFGATITNNSKTIIRDGKRLPFAVAEKAEFNVALGENANAEEVEGNTIPLSWSKSFEELVNLKTKSSTALVLGSVDSGKSGFCTYLVNRLLSEKRKVAILDGDLGQSDVGPPGTVAYTFVAKPITDLFNLKARNASFIGATTPSTDSERMIKGLVLLKKEIQSNEPDFILVNTDGWVLEQDAVNYKARLVEELNPDMVFCIQHGEELTPLLKALEKFQKIIVDSPSVIKPRTIEKRRSLREHGYVKYLKNTKVQSLPLSWLTIEETESLGLGKIKDDTKRSRRLCMLLGMKPLHCVEFKDHILVIIGKRRWIDSENIRKIEDFTKRKLVIMRKGEEEGVLMALLDAQRRFLGIGVLKEIDYLRKNIKILTPVSDEIAIIALGRVKLDKNMKEVQETTEENPLDFSGLKKLF